MMWMGANQWSNHPGQYSLGEDEDREICGTHATFTHTYVTMMGLFGWNCRRRSMLALPPNLKLAVISSPGRLPQSSVMSGESRGIDVQ